MDLNSIGSLASIGSIPLAIILYFVQRNAMVEKAKKAIVKTLSHQIGENLVITNFELSSVLNSKAKDFKLKPSAISPSDIIDSLVVEVVESPLLEKDRKVELLKNLKEVHSRLAAKRFYVERVRLNESSEGVSATEKERKGDITPEEDEGDVGYKESISSLASGIFAVLSLVLTMLSYSFKMGASDLNELIMNYLGDPGFSASLSVFTVVIAASLSWMVVKIYRPKK